MAIDPKKWLLTFTSSDETLPNGHGNPWSDGTEMAKRAKVPGADPWDKGCVVTPLIGGFKAMNEMRDALEQVILDAKSSAQPAGQRGHVYIADWRLNAQRDLSWRNPWSTNPWNSTQVAQDKDQTAAGLVLRLMQAGVVVRILLWLPTPVQVKAAGLQAHILDHVYLAQIVKEENSRLKQHLNPVKPLGIVALDVRVADGAIAGAHHQKMMLIRSPGINVAFCGGVDLAFTRRDAPANPYTYSPSENKFFEGDWQSAEMPDITPAWPPRAIIWPPDGATDYQSAAKVKPPGIKQSSDLPTLGHTEATCVANGGVWDASSRTCGEDVIGGKPIYGMGRHIWHDQHLVLEGPIVGTLEWQFAERWIDSGRPRDVSLVDFTKPLAQALVNWGPAQVFFSSAEAYDGAQTPPAILPLDAPLAEPAIAGATSTVQMWRTIPMRNSRTREPFQRGEFTVMAGYAKTISAAKELIWIFDQYFWSLPLARLLNDRVKKSAACVLVILPPYADTSPPEVHRARKFALNELTRDMTATQRDRVAVFDLWHPSQGDAAKGRGIYVHAKAQTYDGNVLVCGSANLNRRSLTCDSELACAVLDPAVVSAHQHNLWDLLFGNVTGAVGAWPALNLSTTGNGKKFIDAFKAAAAMQGAASLAPDPWNDDNPTLANPKPVVLPNEVPRPVAFPGPKYEVLYGMALDATSLDPKMEQDVVEGTVPRPARLDEVVNRIETTYQNVIGGSIASPWRKQASIVRGAVITWPAIIYPDARAYIYDEIAEWWKQVCLGFPCCDLMQWPDYLTAHVDTFIDGKPAVIQLWKGWCQKFLGMDRMPGGVGAEVGVYRRIPGMIRPTSLPFLPDGIFKNMVLQALASYADNNLWWPYPELNAKLEFNLVNSVTNEVFFEAGPEKSYWLAKWMITRDYDEKYKPNHVTPILAQSYTLHYRINGVDQTPW